MPPSQPVTVAPCWGTGSLWVNLLITGPTEAASRPVRCSDQPPPRLSEDDPQGTEMQVSSAPRQAVSCWDFLPPPLPPT